MSGLSVLVVEDDRWLSEQYARLLGIAGYEVTVTSHALAAIQVIDDVRPDAIVLDVLLTGGTAFALLHELQSYEDTGSIPVILCTNLVNELSIEDLKPYGVRLILDKTTMMPDDLAIALGGVLS